MMSMAYWFKANSYNESASGDEDYSTHSTELGTVLFLFLAFAVGGMSCMLA